SVGLSSVTVSTGSRAAKLIGALTGIAVLRPQVRMRYDHEESTSAYTVEINGRQAELGVGFFLERANAGYSSRYNSATFVCEAFEVMTGEKALSVGLPITDPHDLDLTLKKIVA